MRKSADELICENTRLVHACAKRFVGKGIEYDDLYQNGCLGLVKSANTFDEGRGVQFSTYAVPAILGEIKRLFRDGGSVKVSRSLKELSYKADREKEKLVITLGREPTIGEIAERLDVTSAELSEAMCAASPVTSLTLSDEEGERVLDVPQDDNMQSINERIALTSALDKLEERDRNIIKLRFFTGKTQSETAKLLGMSQVQISRREKFIILQLRQMLA